MNEQIEREFLHALATPLSVLRIVINKLEDATAQTNPTISKEKQLEWISKCKRSLDQMEQLHADHKLKISGAK